MSQVLSQVNGFVHSLSKMAGKHGAPGTREGGFTPTNFG